MAKRLAKSFHCATEFTLAVLDGKWKTVILCYLKERPCRYAELRRLIPRLSDKMLSERLRDLAASGLVVHRKLAGSRGSGHYALTAKGRLLGGLLQHLYSWGLEHAPDFDVEVGEPLKGLHSERKAG